MFRITSGKGFHLTFPNGITLSTQIGAGNYCVNHNQEISEELETKAKNLDVRSCNCEIAIWDKDGKWITKEMNTDLFNNEYPDDVMGYVEIEDWLKIFDWCKNYNPQGEEE